MRHDHGGRRVFSPMREHERPWRDAQPVCKVAIADTVLNGENIVLICETKTNVFY